MKRDQCRGFTLIELIIVITVIAILASVAIPPLVRARRSSCESAAMQVLSSLRSAEVHHKTRYGRYGDLNSLLATGSCPVGEGAEDRVSGYTFTSAADQEHYTIVALPPRTDMTTYTIDETSVYFSD